MARNPTLLVDYDGVKLRVNVAGESSAHSCAYSVGQHYHDAFSSEHDWSECLHHPAKKLQKAAKSCALALPDWLFQMHEVALPAELTGAAIAEQLQAECEHHFAPQSVFTAIPMAVVDNPANGSAEQSYCLLGISQADLEPWQQGLKRLGAAQFFSVEPRSFALQRAVAVAAQACEVECQAIAVLDHQQSLMLVSGLASGLALGLAPERKLLPGMVIEQAPEMLNPSLVQAIQRESTMQSLAVLIPDAHAKALQEQLSPAVEIIWLTSQWQYSIWAPAITGLSLRERASS